jgi:hypothetical protein
VSALAPVRVAPKRMTVPAPARSRPAAARPALRVVGPARRPAGQLPFALLVSGVLGAGLVVLLMLHTLAAQDAFTVHKLQRQSAALGDVEQQLALADQQAQAPSALAARARALGLVPTGSLRIVRHRDGRIVAVASAMPVPVPAPTSSAAPVGSAAAGASASSAPTSGPTTSPSATKPGATKPTKHQAKPRHPH